MTAAQRFLIFGCAGSGKSRLARLIGARTGLPVVHLDALYWRPGWKPPPDEAAFQAEVRAIAAGERWIIDGGFITGSAEARLSRADIAVLFDLPRTLCLYRAIRRYFIHADRTRSDLAAGCHERIDFDFYRHIWTYRRKMLPNLEAQIAEHFRGKLVRIRNARDVDAVLAAL